MRVDWFAMFIVNVRVCSRFRLSKRLILVWAVLKVKLPDSEWRTASGLLSRPVRGATICGAIYGEVEILVKKVAKVGQIGAVTHDRMTTPIGVG